MNMLCKDCKNYKKEESRNVVSCSLSFWEPVEESRAKLLNAMMFECLEWEKLLIK